MEVVYWYNVTLKDNVLTLVASACTIYIDEVQLKGINALSFTGPKVKYTRHKVANII